MLETKEFERVEILNMTILDTLISNAKYGNKLKSFLTVFALNKDYIEMLKQCVLNNNFKNKEKLLATIFNTDQEIWRRIENFIQSKKEKEKFLKAILQILDFNILKEHEQKHMIETYISENNISIDNINKMKLLLSDFQIKYKDISKINIIDKIMPDIIETNSYEINYNNIETILKQNKIEVERIETKNYEAIQEIDILSKYIDSNIEEYINNVYLKLEKQQSNSEQALIKLLNIETLNKELIEKILEKETTKIKNISELNENIWNIVLDKEKMQSSYTNINQYYEKNGLNDTLINYINTIEHLESIVTLKEKESVEQYLDKKLVKEIISENQIKLSLYKEIVLHTKIRYNYITISHLDEEKVICLMENNIFAFTTEMYKRIRECNANIFTLYTNKYIRNIQGKNIKDIDYNIDEINILVTSNKISLNLKRKIIENMKEEDIDSITSEVVNNICNFILKFKIKNNLSFNMLMKILNENRTIQEKVEVIVYNLKLVNINNIKDILKKLDDNYLKIIKDRTTPSFKYTIYNEELIKKLQSLGYHIEYVIENNYIKLKGTKRGNPAA